MEKPKISVIIPVAPWEEQRKALESLKQTDYPKEQIETFLVYGRQPSRQRNLALKEAKGEIIIFLDIDSEFDKSHIGKMIEHHKRYDVVGGPAETARYEKFLGRCFGHVLGSYFATQKMRAKFRGVGKTRETDEKELMSCNLSMKKRILDRYGGFNERLYPNEENELMNRLKTRGIKMLYDPELKIYRKQRKNMYEFAKQIFRYGRGRMEHFLAEPKFINTTFFMPSTFLIYLISLVFYNPIWYMIPLGLYVTMDMIASAEIAIREKDLKTVLVVPILFPIVHISYAMGIFKGLIKKRKTKGGEIIIEKIRLK